MGEDSNVLLHHTPRSVPGGFLRRDLCSPGLRVLPSGRSQGTHPTFSQEHMKTYQLALIAATALVAAACNNNVEKTSQKFNELPPAVQKTARAQAPDAEITDISKTTKDGMDAYEITFRGDNGNPKVIVGTDGHLISSDLPHPAGAVEKMLTPTGASGTPFSALPLPVQHTIKSRAPNAEIASISRHDDNGRAIYEVEFRDKGTNPTIRIAEDGTLVQDLQK